jgi:hypothetical protein
MISHLPFVPYLTSLYLATPDHTPQNQAWHCQTFIFKEPVSKLNHLQVILTKHRHTLTHRTLPDHTVAHLIFLSCNEQHQIYHM